ncbi:FHA domain-containing protein [Corynebacterium sp.]|uniref:FHA domain-containing protein FhaB/FipA n=1 Tax=Corynebacterium sp. TaxID=1720 RepID=UPI0025C57B97|nr:FHA domain-containing protein [Corynebacterium sp.]
MQTTLVLLAKIALLVVLWLFVWVAVRAMRKDVNAMAATAGAAPASGPSAGPKPSGGRGFRRATPPGSLTLTSGPLTGTTLNLQGYRDVTLGRSGSCTVVLEDDFASGTHARLFRQGDTWLLEDLDSRNGSFLNGQRIDQPEQLSAGQEIRIGQTTVRLEA